MFNFNFFKKKETQAINDPAYNELYHILTSSGYAASVPVTESSSLQSAAVKQCVQILSDTIASMPLIAYQDDLNGKERAIHHPVYSLLKKRPNPRQTPFEFLRCIMSHLVLRGNAFVWKQYGDNGEIANLWFLNVSSAKISVAENNKIIYTLTINGQNNLLYEDDVIHFKNLSLDGFFGLSPITICRNARGTTLALQEYGNKYFANGANVSGILTTDQDLREDKIKSILAQWNSVHSGVSNVGKTTILDHGFKYSPVASTNADAQFLESKKYSVAEIARIFNVPPSKLYDFDGGTTTVEQQNLAFYQNSILPYLVNIEQNLNKSLFYSYEDCYAEFMVDNLLRADITTRYNAYGVGISNGFLLIDEVRVKENLCKLPNGDKALIQGATITLDQVIDHPFSDKTPQKQEEKRSENVIIEAFKTDISNRISDKEAYHIGKKMEKISENEEETRSYLTNYFDNQYEFMRNELSGISKVLSITDDNIKSYLQSRKEELTDNILNRKENVFAENRSVEKLWQN